MPRFLQKFASPPLVALLCLSMMLGLTPRYAAAAKAETAIEHQPLEFVVPAKRIKIEAKVTDPKGVQLVRCYFRAAKTSTPFAHVDMVKTGENTFVAELPAPASGSTGIEYALLVVNGQRSIAKSGNLLVPAKYDQSVPAWQSATSARKIAVSMERTPTPTTLAGFEDNLSITGTDASQCYGALAGLTDAPASATSAAGASFAGAVPVTYGGISTNTALLIAGGAVLVGGGIAIAAAASGGGGGGGGGGGSTPAPGCQCTGDTTVTKTTVNLTVLVDDETVRDDDMVVHVKVNGNFVFANEVLNHTGATTTISLNACPSVNTITVVAINQSDDPPNRGALQITDQAPGKPFKLNWSLMAGDEQNFTVCTQ
ncbi:MAG: hypothetical protein HY794_04110 [Desulfarculus sp.]|nr:hypothetical protein [Desulfarculus sp.]